MVDPFLHITIQNIYSSAFVCKPYNHKKHTCCFKKCTESLCTLVTRYDTPMSVQRFVPGCDNYRYGCQDRLLFPCELDKASKDKW